MRRHTTEQLVLYSLNAFFLGVGMGTILITRNIDHPATILVLTLALLLVMINVGYSWQGRY